MRRRFSRTGHSVWRSWRSSMSYAWRPKILRGTYIGDSCARGSSAQNDCASGERATEPGAVADHSRRESVRRRLVTELVLRASLARHDMPGAARLGSAWPSRYRNVISPTTAVWLGSSTPTQLTRTEPLRYKRRAILAASALEEAPDCGQCVGTRLAEADTPSSPQAGKPTGCLIERGGSRR